MRLLPYGDRAVLVELESLDQVHQLHRAVLRSGIAVDAVPGWRTLLVTSDDAVETLANHIRSLDARSEGAFSAATHVVPVTYDGEDLDFVARECGLRSQDVVDLHQATQFTVAFLGFTRGFPYLRGLPDALRLPRRATPRIAVPAGSVAIALDQCGIYPSASPGGWHLIGTTHRQLFDERRVPPTPLHVGDHVRFVVT